MDTASNVWNDSMELDAIHCFLKVAELRSLTGAARLHQIPKSSMSQKIRRLEDELGVALFIREGRSMFLSNAGLEFVEHAHRILVTCSDAHEAMAITREEVSGTLIIGSTGEFGTSFMSELLCAFRWKYPLVKIDVSVLSASQLFSSEQKEVFDGIFTWEEPSRLDYIARCLTKTSFGLYANSEYLERHGYPIGPQDLNRHKGILIRGPGGLRTWHLHHGEDSIDILPLFDCVTNDYWMAKYFAVAGEGIALLPRFFTTTECANGTLLPILDTWLSPEVAVNILYPRRRYVPQKFRAFLEFCLAYYAEGRESAVPRYFAGVERGERRD